MSGSFRQILESLKQRLGMEPDKTNAKGEESRREDKSASSERPVQLQEWILAFEQFEQHYNQRSKLIVIQNDQSAQNAQI
jgi:hypothetical protein